MSEKNLHLDLSDFMRRGSKGNLLMMICIFNKYLSMVVVIVGGNRYFCSISSFLFFFVLYQPDILVIVNNTSLHHHLFNFQYAFLQLLVVMEDN